MKKRVEDGSFVERPDLDRKLSAALVTKESLSLFMEPEEVGKLHSSSML